MTGWIVFAVFALLIAGEALRRGVCRYSGSIAHIVGRWRDEDAAKEFAVYFDKTHVGYVESGDRIETFSFVVVGRRIVMERDCRKKCGQGQKSHCDWLPCAKIRRYSQKGISRS